jgi:uncharacterized membrane protein
MLGGASDKNVILSGASDSERSRRTSGDEHTIHRLEAFSDIVIGFCIAEMGVNLFIPRTAAELPSIVTGTNAFVVSFILISVLWWIHHRLFKSLFILNPVTLILNFAMLGSLVLMVYFQQISVHLIAANDRVGVAVQLWFVSYAVVYALLAAMLWIGLRARWESLPLHDARWGLNRAILASTGVLIFLACAAVFELHGNLRNLVFVMVGLALVLRFVVGQLVRRFMARRVVSS